MTIGLSWQEVISQSNVLKAIDSIHQARTRNDSANAVCLVFQGGGMLGIAHVGALYALEQLGKSVYQVAGTSAGAIMATLVAAANANQGSSPVPSLAETVFADLASMQPSSFLDRSPNLRRLVTLAGTRPGTWDLTRTVATAIFPAMRVLRREYGLHRANTVSSWLDQRLARHGVHRLSDLRNVNVVTSALPYGIKVVLPHHAHIFDIHTDLERPSLWVRASMAIPLVFTPVELPLKPVEWRNYCENECKDMLSQHQLAELSQARSMLFFDGGLFSNLPVDLYHDETPTITIALYSSKSSIRGPSPLRSKRRLFRHLTELVHAMRGLRDFEARHARTRAKTNDTIWIDTQDAGWLNFTDAPAFAASLFACGVQGVANWLNKRPDPARHHEPGSDAS